MGSFFEHACVRIVALGLRGFHDLVNARCDTQPRAAANNGELVMTFHDILAGLNTNIDTELRENANRCSPQLIQELAQAIAACERSPLLPIEIEELCEVVAEAECLRVEARKIKDDLPFFLRASSAVKLSELAASLWDCAGLARR